MKNYLFFLFLVTQLLIYVNWILFLKKKSPYFWETIRVKKGTLLMTLLLAIGFQILKLSHLISSVNSEFYFSHRCGEIIVKICFIITLSTSLAYTFFNDRFKENNLHSNNFLIDVLTLFLLLGFILLNWGSL